MVEKSMSEQSNERLRVKICGLTSLEDARFVSGALADYLGFIFYEKSPRYIDPSRAGAIANWIEGPETVGVFVNQPPDDVNQIVRHSGLDLVQLHGTESPEYCALMDKPVIKAFHVGSDTTSEELKQMVQPYLEHVSYLLFDTKKQGFWGGTGESFDWGLLQEVSALKPFFLSGGLNPDNIVQALQQVQPWAIDLSSGVEKAPGIKDYDKLERLFDTIEEIGLERAESPDRKQKK